MTIKEEFEEKLEEGEFNNVFSSADSEGVENYEELSSDKVYNFFAEKMKEIALDAYSLGLTAYDGVEWDKDPGKAVEQSDVIDDEIIQDLFNKYGL